MVPSWVLGPAFLSLLECFCPKDQFKVENLEMNWFWGSCSPNFYFSINDFVDFYIWFQPKGSLFNFVT
jgi:hypothetical protein